MFPGHNDFPLMILSAGSLRIVLSGFRRIGI